MTLIKRATNESKLIAFQYKLLHNIVPNRYNLKKWKIREDSTCKYCQNDETLLHMYAECPETKRIMTEVLNMIRKDRLDVKTFLFGSMSESDTHIFLITKWLIWKSRFYDIKLHINMIKSEIKIRINTDNSFLKEQKFIDKWQNLITLLDI